ncbi:hypothetical protein Vafri_12725, partial [Volvox africanus]
IAPGTPVLSMREAVLMVSPKRQNRGMRVPTTPLMAGPLWMPTRSRTGSPVLGRRTVLAACRSAWGKSTEMKGGDGPGSGLGGVCLYRMYVYGYSAEPVFIIRYLRGLSPSLTRHSIQFEFRQTMRELQ